MEEGVGWVYHIAIGADGGPLNSHECYVRVTQRTAVVPDLPLNGIERAHRPQHRQSAWGELGLLLPLLGLLDT